MKRLTYIALSMVVIVHILLGAAMAADTSRSYDFSLLVDGKQEIAAMPGQIVTVSLALSRTDKDEAANVYAVQAELLYDDQFFELVDGSVMTAASVQWEDMARRTGGRAFYLNFLSLTGGEEWNSRVQLGNFQFRVIASGGAATIRSENCIVSVPDGTDSYASVNNDVTVVVTTECTVSFESGGGSDVPGQTVQYGERIIEPDEPTREGYTFNGWYRDLDRTILWNFETDTVQGNMTLYAGWLAGSAKETPQGESFPWWLILVCAGLLLLLLLLALGGKKKVTLHSCGGTSLDPVYVKKNSLLPKPMTPEKPGALFDGWYTEAESGARWNFEQDKVKKNMTLYAHWK